MKNKSPLLVGLFVALLLGSSFFVFSHNSAKSDEGPFKPPPPAIYGYVTYSNGCQYTTHDTVWVESGGQKIGHTLVYHYSGSVYIYTIELDDLGSYTIFGFQGPSGCGTDPYDVNYTGSNRQDIVFYIAP